MKDSVRDPLCLCGVRKSNHHGVPESQCAFFRRAFVQPDAPRRVSHHKHGEPKATRQLSWRQ